MNKPQLEKWVLDVVDQIVSNHNVEDSRVECKREWIIPEKAARLIAGHANAARGDPILWLIGVDEKAGLIPGAALNELADWLPSMESRFDGIAPKLSLHLNVPRGESTVAAMLFETDRAPYVVKSSVPGEVSHEVPWREGTRTRSARREDLIRMLIPRQVSPEIELLKAELAAQLPAGSTSGERITGQITLYIVPIISDTLIIPFRKTSLSLDIEGAQLHFQPERLGPHVYLNWGDRHRPPSSEVRSLTIAATDTEVIVTGAGELLIEFGHSEEGASLFTQHRSPVKMTGKLLPAGFELPVVFDCVMEPEGPGKWSYQAPPYR
jgi:hypothetical protein